MSRIAGMLALVLWACLPAPVYSGDPTIGFTNDDKAMSNAIELARASLPLFLEHGFEDRQSLAGMSLKVKIPIPGQDAVEVIWMSPVVKRFVGGYRGLLANDPNNLGKLRIGDSVSFRRDQIADWAFVAEDGQLYGHFTTRVMLPGLPADQQAELTAILSPNPVPGFWK